MEHAHGSLKTELKKMKTGELYPQIAHNALSHVHFMLNFLKMDVHKQYLADRFWHDGTKVTFDKAM